MAADIEAIRARWPASPNDLPEAALAVFAAWSRATEETIRKALEDEVGRGFVKPKGTYTKDHKCRDLTILRSPLPRTLRVAGAHTALSLRPLADIGTVSPGAESPSPHEPPHGGGSPLLFLSIIISNSYWLSCSFVTCWCIL
jgi:hypothetical protein